MQTCPHCGFVENQDAIRFCGQCGKPLTTLSSTGRLEMGTVLQERYKALRILGKGGMGAVYLVEDQRLFGKQWALKEVIGNPTSAEYAEAANRFQQEARILVGLSHPNLPQVVATFTEDGREYLVMEYVQGETLGEYLQRYPNGIPQEIVLSWAGQLCDVLGYLHGQNPPVIFRDFKPSNIMVTEEGWIKIVDFGIARIFDPAKSQDTLEMGTIGYAPPEQYGQGQTDARSDIYALGATLHHLLTGRHPGEQPFVFPELNEYPISVSPQVNKVISKSVAFKPEQRYQSTRELKKELLQELESAIPKRKRKKKVPWLVIVLAGVIFISLFTCSALLAAGTIDLETFQFWIRPTLTRTATHTPLPSNTPSSTVTPTPTETATAEPTATETPSPTIAPSATATAAPTWTLPPTPTSVQEPIPTATPTATPTVGNTALPAVTNTLPPPTQPPAPTQAPAPTQPPATKKPPPPPTQPPPPPPTDPPPPTPGG